ncbi:feather keratin I [Chelydra serpentina]|uniref:Feather keratin I n=1 Tax=Chelydra serpentina TaxID=8475 RepID=A0A8T1RXT4_CHESE|nr:feather keratin I [Chelydra serpentina]
MHNCCNKPDIRRCPDSTVLIQPPPAVVTFPGAILSSFPQESIAGASGAAAIRGAEGGPYGSGGLQASGGW